VCLPVSKASFNSSLCAVMLNKVSKTARIVILSQQPFFVISWVICQKRNSLCLIVHKMFIRNAPNYIASLLTPASNIPSRSSLRSLSNCDLVVPRTSRIATPRAWLLLTDLKLLCSTASFKNILKSFLFHAAYTLNTVWTLKCAIGLIVGGTLQVTVVIVTTCQLR